MTTILKKISRTVIVSVGIVLLSSSMWVMPASAASDPVTELLALNPGLGRAELLASIHEVAEASGISDDELVAQGLAEARESVAASRLPTTRSGGVATTVRLQNANYPGDVFYAPASTLTVEHGHSGIYYTVATIVEAPGSGQVSRSLLAATKLVGSGTLMQYVNVPYADGVKAGKYAYDNLRNKPYNSNFTANRNPDAASMNCSQLVWAAYKKTLNIDLDSNSGLGVYPRDIRDSPWTVTYKTL